MSAFLQHCACKVEKKPRHSASVHVAKEMQLSVKEVAASDVPAWKTQPWWVQVGILGKQIDAGMQGGQRQQVADLTALKQALQADVSQQVQTSAEALVGAFESNISALKQELEAKLTELKAEIDHGAKRNAAAAGEASSRDGSSRA